MRFRLLTWLVILTCPLFAQLNIQLKSAGTNATIENANAYLPEINSTYLSNKEGKIIIAQRNKTKTNIIISHIGYQSIQFYADLSSPKDTTIFMNQSHMDIQEVVFSVPLSKLQKDNVISVERKSFEELDVSAQLNLVQSLTKLAGIDQRSTGSGISKAVIRGLSGNRIVSYAQGIRVENQQWGDEHGMGIGSIGIEAVEIIKGPASLLYGSDALGGVLYFVDERYTRESNSEMHINNSSWSNTYGNQLGFSYKYNKKGFKWNLHASDARHMDYLVPAQIRVYNTRFKENNVKFRTGFAKKNWVSNMSYSFQHNNFGITEADSVYSSSTERASQLPYQKIASHLLAWENTLFIADSRITLSLGHNNNVRSEFEDELETAVLKMALNSSSYTAKWYTPQWIKGLDVILGSQGMHQTNRNKGEEELIPDAVTNDLGLFSHFSLGKKRIKAQAGVRYDHRYIGFASQVDLIQPLERNFNNLNYAAGILCQLKPLELRLNYSTGYRAPHSAELLANGVHEGTNAYLIGSFDLISEYAQQIDFSLAYETEHLQLSASVFYNSIANYIYLNPLDSIIENEYAYAYAQKDAVLYGTELGMHYHPHHIHWLHIESNYSFLKAEDKTGMALPLMPSNKWKSSLSLDLNHWLKSPFERIVIEHVYSFRQSRVGLFETGTNAYQITNLAFNWKQASAEKESRIVLSTGIQNLFNTSYTDHLSRLKNIGVYNMGRNVYISFKYQLNTKH